MTRMDRSSGSIGGHFPVAADAEQPRIVEPGEGQALTTKLQYLIRQAYQLNERSCALHLKFALASIKSSMPFNSQEPCNRQEP